MIEGLISPPVENVTVTVQIAENVVATTLSSAEGTYVFGPLEVGKDYKVWARKDDYIIEENGDRDFSSQKMSKLEVKVVD